MFRRARSASRITYRVPVGTLLVATFFGCEEQACLTPPCPQPFAAQVTVRSAATSQRVVGVSVLVGDPAQSAPCSEVATCTIVGGPGRYTFTVSAPGYETTSRTVTVTGSSPGCGCGQVNTQNVDVLLVPIA